MNNENYNRQSNPQQPVQDNVNQTTSSKSAGSNRAISTLITILLLLFMFPIGIIVMWVLAPWSKGFKWFLTLFFPVGFALAFGLILLNQSRHKSSIIGPSPSSKSGNVNTQVQTPSTQPATNKATTSSPTSYSQQTPTSTNSGAAVGSGTGTITAIQPGVSITIRSDSVTKTFYTSSVQAYNAKGEKISQSDIQVGKEAVFGWVVATNQLNMLMVNQ